MTSESQVVYDVLIAGAGPVGLFLAGELALAGCSVLVLEKAADSPSPLKQLPFGVRGLNALSVEALDRRGLLGELHVHERFKVPHSTSTTASKPQAAGGGHFAGLPFQPDLIDPAQWPYRLPSDPPTSLLSELAELETVLAARATALDVVIRYGAGFTGLEQTDDGVTVQTSDESVAGRWLVGCDGGRSAVRKALDIDFAGTEPEFTGYTAQLTIADPEKLKPGRNMTATGMYLQSQPGFLILQDFDGGAFHSAGQPITREWIQELLRRISGTDVTVTALHTATTWTDRARQATAYRQGRVLLAGDAAHIHAPLGGQGLNLGLGDALNLGWKLAATLRGHAPAGLLDTYFAERHPLGVKVLDWSRAQVAVMRPDAAGHALRGLLADLLATPDGATYFAGRVWGTTTRYDLGDPHPLTGRSVPNFVFADGPSTNEQLRTGHGLLLDFAGDAALQALAADYGVEYVNGQPHDSLGLSAVLVRPDGIVAWATDGAVDMAEARQAAGRWFGVRTAVAS